ncbi:MAG: hypothetical protein AAGK34_03215 [Planctomycetota bacterium]|jgi:hypothetical protein|nr:MAG: hypothetical protein EVA77_04515 [Phycisphaeraceae bacterium]
MPRNVCTGLFVWFCLAASAFGQSAPEALCDLLVRRARMFAAIPLATSSDLEFAHMVAVRATELVPTDAEAWRLRMDIARLHEDQKDAELCLRRLIKLRPSDERLVLERLDLALSDRQTVESRLEGLDVILAEPLSGPLQARLWWRRALLRQGRGDGDWREDAANAAVADPSFSAPLAALVTPTLAQKKADPAEVIEALAALAAATPADADTAARLGRRLLRYGAYADAQAALMAAVSSAERMGQRPPPTLLADLLLCLLAEDGPAAVRSALAERVMPLKRASRMRIMAEAVTSDDYLQAVPEPILGVRSSRVVADLALLLSATAHLEGLEAPDQPVRQLLRLFTDGPSDVQILAQPELASVNLLRGKELDAFRLRVSWWTLAFGGDPALARSDLEAIATEDVISEQDQVVFDGWFALRSGELEKATTLLGSRAEDPRARFGLAKVAKLAGRSEEMIDHAAFVARVVPESVVGVLSVRMLSDHFGRAVRPASHALAVAAAAGDIPEHLEELHLHPERVLDVRLLPQDVIGQPFAPFDLTFEIKNIGTLPVPMGEGGLSEFLALEIESDLSRRGMVRHGRPASFRLEGPLVLAPGQRCQQTIGLRRLPVSADIDRAGVLGASIEFQVITQPVGLPIASGPFPMVKPGPIGSLSSSGTFRIPGTLLNKDAIRQLRMTTEESQSETPLPVLAQLGQYIALGLDGQVSEDVAQEIQLAREVFLRQFATLDANSRAFLTGVLPKNQMPAVLSTQVSDDPDRWVRTMYLLNHVADEFDPALNRARNDPDPLLQLTAEVVDGLIGLIREVEG